MYTGNACYDEERKTKCYSYKECTQKLSFRMCAAWIRTRLIYPKYTAGILSGQIPMDILEDKLKRTENSCVYLTSPDYLGKNGGYKRDIKAMQEI